MLKILLCFLSLACAAHAQQIASPERIAQYKAALPLVEDNDWQALFDDPTTIYYSDAEMPPAFQHNMGEGQPVTTFHTPFYNFSGDAQESRKPHGKGGNGNIEFPWLKPGGTDNSPNVTSYKMLWLPKQDNGQPHPVVVWTERVTKPKSIDPPYIVYRWTFPRGTIFGEVLLNRGVCFEVRLRVRHDTYWDIEILRPFPTAEDYGLALDAQAREALAARKSLQLVDYVDTTHTNSAFSAKAVFDQIPPIDERKAAELLRTTPFRSSVGHVWAKQPNGEPAFAPTTHAASFQIIPPAYAGTMLGTSNESCTKCHESTGKNVNHFTAFRGWYGHVKGNDGIFTWHPVEPNSIASGGGTIPVRFREAFTRAGIVTSFDPAKHTAERYQQLK